MLRTDRIPNYETSNRMSIKKNGVKEKTLQWHGHVRRTNNGIWIKKITRGWRLGKRERKIDT